MMDIGFSQPNIIVSTSRKSSINFTKKAAQNTEKKESATGILQNKETRNYVLGGIGVLALLGFALLNREKVLEIFSKEKKHLKKYIRPTTTSRVVVSNIHGGPDIDLSGGPSKLHKAWTKYINEIKINRKNNGENFKRIRDAFAENAIKADELEILAKARVTKRGGSWTV